MSLNMITDGFYDAMFDPSFDSTTSTDFTLYGNWNNDYNFDGVYAMTDQQTYQTSTWRSKPTTSWTTNEVLHWMCNEATSNKRNYEDIKLEKFTNISGETFRDMTLDHFVDLTESLEDGQLFYKSKEALVKSPHDDCNSNRNELHCRNTLQDSIEQRPSSTDKIRKRGRPPHPSRPIRRKPEKRFGKLWEFLRNLLLNNETCPSLIKWDNYQEGKFKFVQSEKVAKLWGDRKKNDKMNYEKFSRAMRYYYRSRVLQPVAGKRLVYRFGPAATGWRTDNPIL